MARCDLGWYSGDDILNLPLLSVGANGFISVVGHLVADRLRAMGEAFHSGDVCGAIAINRALLPVYAGIFRTQGVILTKAALRLQGLPAGPVRSPLVDATADQIGQLESDLREGGVDLS
jgi:4-hydroxy-tetrahydrodipicolinate synthase